MVTEELYRALLEAFTRMFSLSSNLFENQDITGYDPAVLENPKGTYGRKISTRSAASARKAKVQ